MKLRDVLVVDDSPTMRMLVAFALGKYGDWNLREAGNGIEALRVMRDTQFDLIVADINMPEMNGFELLRAIRVDRRHKDVPVVIITTEGSDDDIRLGLQSGATEYLVKPFQPQKLHSIIERLYDVVPVHS